MNVFEDLLEELEEEHLLEKTVSHNSGEKKISEPLGVELLDLPNFEDSDAAELLEAEILVSYNDSADEELLETANFLKHLEAEEQNELTGRVNIEENLLEIESPTQIPLDSLNPPPPQTHNEPQNINPKQKLSEFEFFRKRAVEEVSSLQMVDNIFSSVEREQMKIAPKPFYDLPVKKILHTFLQLPGDVNLSEHVEAEFELRQETENWYSALSLRDQQISVENLRYCCETTRPPLSAPAMLALAKFYRNAPFSEAVRNKFDLIITRLFSRDIEDDKRELVFSREELNEHLTDLYGEWESIPVYSTDKNDEELLLFVLKFEDFITEVNKADEFDDLISTEFFNRVRALKRSTGESFFAPQIAATSIICNVKIGNRYLDLLCLEQEKSFEETLEEKYGYLFDQSISDSTNKSLQIVEILKQRREKPKIFDLRSIERQQSPKNNQKANSKQQNFNRINFQWLYGINKGILAVAVLSLFLCAGLYLWVDVFAAPPKIAENVQELSVENTEFKDSIKSARINNETLFAISSPAWKDFPPEKKQEILNKLFAKGKEKGYKKVHILNQEGLTVGAATQNKVEVK